MRTGGRAGRAGRDERDELVVVGSRQALEAEAQVARNHLITRLVPPAPLGNHHGEGNMVMISSEALQAYGEVCTQAAEMAGRARLRTRDELELEQWKENYDSINCFSAAEEYLRLCKEDATYRTANPALYFKAKWIVRSGREAAALRERKRHAALAPVRLALTVLRQGWNIARLVVLPRTSSVAVMVWSGMKSRVKAVSRARTLVRQDPVFQADAQEVRKEMSYPADSSSPQEHAARGTEGQAAPSAEANVVRSVAGEALHEQDAQPRGKKAKTERGSARRARREMKRQGGVSEEAA